MNVNKAYLVKYNHGLMPDQVVYAPDEDAARRQGAAEYKYHAYGIDEFPIRFVVASVTEIPDCASTTRRLSQVGEWKASR